MAAPRRRRLRHVLRALRPRDPCPHCSAQQGSDAEREAAIVQQHGLPLLSRPAALSAAEVSSYRRDGYLLLDGGLAAEAAEQIIAACARVQAIKNAAVAGGVDPHGRTQPGALAAEMDGYLEGLVGHPELQALVRCVLSPGRVAFDHAVLLNRGDREGSASLHPPPPGGREAEWAH